MHSLKYFLVTIERKLEWKTTTTFSSKFSKTLSINMGSIYIRRMACYMLNFFFRNHSYQLVTLTSHAMQATCNWPADGPSKPPHYKNYHHHSCLSNYKVCNTWVINNVFMSSKHHLLSLFFAYKHKKEG